MNLTPSEVGNLTTQILNTLAQSDEVPKDLNGIELSTGLRAAASVVEAAMAGQAYTLAMEKLLADE